MYNKHISLIAFCVLGLIWGSNFIYMKISTDYLSALQIVYMRVLFGFIAVLGYSLQYKKLRIKDLKHILHFFVMSLLATSVYYFCFVKGTALLLSGVAGAVSASIPLFTFMLSVIFLPEEKVTLKKLAGITLGLLGVVVIAVPSGDAVFSANMKGVLYIVAGAFSLGASFVYAKKFISPLNINPPALVTYQLGCALIVLAVIVDYNNLFNIFTNTNAALGLIVGLGALGTGVAYIIYYFLVSRLGPITASSATYLPPIVALVIGAVIVGEPISMSDYIASALILAGVFLLKSK